MGNPQHLEWLLEGVDAWNARRKREPFVPDLSGINVRHEFEVRNRLSRQSTVPLREVNFSQAILERSNFWGADLCNADLRGANLERANLISAYLNGADLRGARLFETALHNTMLACSVSGVSPIDVTAIDQRKVPDELRRETNAIGAIGLTQSQLSTAIGDHFILLPDHLHPPDHWMINQEVFDPDDDASEEHYDVEDNYVLFLSYAHADQPQAQSLRDLLQAESIAVWWDQEIMGGERWRDRLLEELEPDLECGWSHLIWYFTTEFDRRQGRPHGLERDHPREV